MIRMSALLGAAALVAATGTAHAQGDAARGEKLFEQCHACHSVERGAKCFDLFSVLRPITGALGIDGALVVGLRFFSERGELR